MSTPPAAGPHDGERRKSLGKYVKRMSSVFKREKPNKSVPRPSSAAAFVAHGAPEVEQQQPSQTEVPQEEVATQQVAQEPAKAHSTNKPEEPTAALATAAAAADLAPTTSVQARAPAPVQVNSVLDRNAMQQERARALFAKYGLTLESDDLFKTGVSAPLAPRVEKAIRMRVHRSCHRCGTLYGHGKVCVQCEHNRCKKCPRYPKKKTATEEKENQPVEQPQKKKVLTLTTRNGNELAYQHPTQRIRRSCHKCGAFFIPSTSTTCESCNHSRCTKCPREPAKRNKWPSGYPGDVAADSDDDDDVEGAKQLDQFRRIWRKPRRIVRWECEQCHGLFRQGSHQCPGCGHERCDQCTRSPVKKQRREESFDPAVVAAVEAKLRALGVDSDPPTSEPEHV